jgi:serine/threonine protein kinase
LKEITNNFSNERVIGRGGSGVVYKGILQSGETVAVKKLVAWPGSQKHYENEVYRFMKLEHPNIVRFKGYCYETQHICLEHNGRFVFAEKTEMLLCLEYLPKGSLDRYLSDGSSRYDWQTRYKIIEGICYGLHYLQEQIDKPILHLDLKPANILLDDNMIPKITDFGLSRLLDHQQTIYTATRDGTFGYMAPEYINEGTITAKSDIFSLGVIIMEVITGHRDHPDVTRSSFQDFIDLELKKWRNELEKASLYTSLEMHCQQIKRCIQIGLTCLNPERTKRPRIMQIIEMLEGLASMNCDVVSNEKTSSVNQIMSDPSELLVIEPRELRFWLNLYGLRSRNVRLTNRTEDHVAFCIGLTRGTSFYSIEPRSGFLQPRSTIVVIITMEGRSELPSELHCNDEFLVRSIVVGDYSLTTGITEGFFNILPSNVVHKVKLTVVFG